MAKSSPLSKLKDIAAQMLNIKRDMQKELTDIRKKISVLEDERKKISNYNLSRSDLLTATMVNVDNLHNKFLSKLTQHILYKAERTNRGDHYGDAKISYLESVVQGVASEHRFSSLTGLDAPGLFEALFLYSHEEIKRTITSAFESINDADWPECTSIPATDSLARLAEIDSQMTELHRREGELIAAANLEGVDIGQG